MWGPPIPLRRLPVMREARATSRAVESAGRLFVLLAALAGPFSTHGLFCHRTAGRAAPPESGSVGAQVPHGAMLGMAEDSPSVAAIAEAFDADDIGATELCLAVLGVGMLLWHHRVSTRDPGALRPGIWLRAGVRPSARAPDPLASSVCRFSVVGTELTRISSASWHLFAPNPPAERETCCAR